MRARPRAGSGQLPTDTALRSRRGAGVTAARAPPPTHAHHFPPAPGACAGSGMFTGAARLIWRASDQQAHDLLACLLGIHEAGTTGGSRLGLCEARGLKPTALGLGRWWFWVGGVHRGAGNSPQHSWRGGV